MTTDFYQLRRERIARAYDDGRWLIAMTDMDIEVDEELVRIVLGHKLTRDEALAYPGDVQYGGQKHD